MQIIFFLCVNMHLSSSLFLFNHVFSSTHVNVMQAIWSNLTINTTKMTNGDKVRNHTIPFSMDRCFPLSLWLSWLLDRISPPLLIAKTRLLARLSLHD